ncbi:hypothetical protein VXN63_04920 [Marinilactibacillus sp. XAAS-LB27]|uniref:hypothetical protein n=1 Tax=Marinilactibacillus sp. XAAS-LB27 TaxID=3114538 RepID=UPI002E17D132|nr:hypothetical protein [Marinilactibacillus sp. XAAS-LB27]
MNSKMVKKISLLGYLFPYIFLSMYADFTFGSMMMYLFMLIAFVFLSLFITKNDQRELIVKGNIVSYCSSALLILTSGMLENQWYFKPFSAMGLLFFVTTMMVFIQLMCIKLYSKKRVHQ